MTKTAKSLSLLLLLSLPIAALIALPNAQAGKPGYPDFDPIREDEEFVALVHPQAS